MNDSTTTSRIRRRHPSSRKLFTRICCLMTLAGGLSLGNAFSVSSSRGRSSTTTTRSTKAPSTVGTLFTSRSTLWATTTTAAATRASSQNVLQPHHPRLTHTEQAQLLQQATEARRIQNLQQQLASFHRDSMIHLARITGYHDVTSLQQAMRHGHDAREKLVTHNMGLVHYCVQDIVGSKRTLRSISREDLLQEGAIGLARAVDKWNPDIGGRFSTYAVYWVRAAILRCLAERDDVMRVPEHVTAAVRKVSKAAKSLGIEIPSGPNAESLLSSVYNHYHGSTNQIHHNGWKEAKAAKELAEAAGLTDQQLQRALQVRHRRNGGIASFESWMEKGNQADSIHDTSITAMDEGSELQRDELRKTLARFLRPKEMEALCLRYGLEEETASPTKASSKQGSSSALGSSADSERHPLPTGGRWGEAMTFHEVGKRMQVSAEYGRRLCHGALEKLRRAADEGKLELAFWM